MQHFDNLAKPLIDSQNYDVVCFGHNHRHEIARVHDAWLVNPGAILGYQPIGAQDVTPTFVVYDTERDEPVTWRIAGRRRGAGRGGSSWLGSPARLAPRDPAVPWRWRNVAPAPEVPMDPLDVLRTTPERLAHVVEQHPASVLATHPFEGKWSPTEILGHFVDHELVTACRLRKTRLDAVPWISPYAQDDWVARQQHARGEPLEFVRRFTELRRMNVEQYEALTPKELRRARPRPEGGEISMEQLLRRHAGHDEIHLAQLDRFLAELEQTERA